MLGILEQIYDLFNCCGINNDLFLNNIVIGYKIDHPECIDINRIFFFNYYFLIYKTYLLSESRTIKV